jgi:cystathionine beta-synthase
LQRAAYIFREHGISQLPVLDNGVMVGAIQEITIVHALHRGVDTSNIALRDVMARPLECVDAGVLLEEVYRLLLSGNTAVAVVRDGILIGLITRADLMEFYQRVGRANTNYGGSK